jgi:hypothetical protein
MSTKLGVSTGSNATHGWTTNPAMRSARSVNVNDPESLPFLARDFRRLSFSSRVKPYASNKYSMAQSIVIGADNVNDTMLDS